MDNTHAPDRAPTGLPTHASVQASGCPGWLRTAAPIAVVVVVLALLTVGFYLFPVIKGIVTYQDCVASGRMDCEQTQSF